jgi:acyl-CoA synthetase (AMP-forming)/AMP-acid ligase II
MDESDDSTAAASADELRGSVGAGSLASLLAWRAQERPGHRFLYVEDESSWTFGELAASARALAARLAAVGVPPGGRVLVRVGNDERFLPSLVAGWLARSAAVPMHPAVPAAEVARVVGSMGISAVVCDPGDPAVTLGLSVPVISLDRLEHEAQTAPGPLLAPPGVDGAEPALVLLTSGSTGAPKGVVLTHDNAWSNLRATVSAFRSDTGPSPLPVTRKPPNLIANPLSHTAGVVRLLFALYVGRDVVLLRKFDGALAKRLVDAFGIDNLTLNPAMLRMLLDEVPPGEGLGAVRYVSSGTAPLPPALREQFESRFGVPVLQAYGQTEAFGGIAIENVRDVLAGRRKPDSVGKPLPGVQLRLVDPQGRDVRAGESGEIWVRSRSATAGYLGASQADPRDEQGWLRTGDIGCLDEEGYLYVTGRIKNIIICGGFNITPEEVEAALEQDPRITEAVVVGIPDERLGEIPVAIVESEARAPDLLAAVAPRLASYKRPRKLFRVDTLPRVPNGKIDRTAAAELVTVLSAGQPA